MPINREIQAFIHGTENLFNDELINQDAAQASQNWYNQSGRLVLIPGKVLLGQSGVVGNITGEIFGYKSDGTKVHWQKAGTKIQYLNGSVWTDVVTGLTADADYSFSNYSSLSGSFTFAVGVDGIFKMNNASPGSYSSMYNSTKNFKGKAIIDKGRMLLWDIPGDKTVLRGSKIDPQNGTVYTSVSGEATTSLSGTLAFRAGGGTRNCFGILLTITGSGEVYKDDNIGGLTGSLGGTGTINYTTGAYTLSNPGVGTVSYQWEDSNAGGLTDFTKSSTRVAGEGFQFPQDEGGDAILNVVIGSNGYYSMKSGSAYRLLIDNDDLGATNEVYRKQLGVQSYRGSLSTSQGIIFINTQNPDKPVMTRLEPNLAGDSLVPKELFPNFKFANYLYDDASFWTYERYVVVACKSITAINNDIILLCDASAGTVNIVKQSGRTFASDGALLYMGSSVVQSTYQLFSGFDDDGYAIDNYWIGKGETYAIKTRSMKYAAFGQSLKKIRRIRLKGSISREQSYEVYVSYDNAGFQLVGTVVGTGSYVDYSSPQTIGSNYVGEAQIGGDQLSPVYSYFAEIRLRKVPKFRKRTIKFVALGIGYVSVEYQEDYDLSLYEQKIPARFRQKQNVSLDGLETGLSLSPTGTGMLLQDGSSLLLEDGGSLLLN